MILAKATQRERFYDSSHLAVNSMSVPFSIDAASFFDRHMNTQEANWESKAYRAILNNAVPVDKIKEYLKSAEVMHKHSFKDQLIMLGLAKSAVQFVETLDPSRNEQVQSLHRYALNSLDAISKSIDPVTHFAAQNKKKEEVKPQSVQVKIAAKPVPKSFVHLKRKDEISADNSVHLIAAMQEFHSLAAKVHLVVRDYDEPKRLAKYESNYPHLLANIRHKKSNYDAARISRRTRRNPYWRLTARLALQISICEQVLLMTEDAPFRMYLLNQINVLQSTFMSNLRSISTAADFMKAMNEQYEKEVEQNVSTEKRKNHCLLLETV